MFPLQERHKVSTNTARTKTTCTQSSTQESLENAVKLWAVLFHLAPPMYPFPAGEELTYLFGVLRIELQDSTRSPGLQRVKEIMNPLPKTDLCYNTACLPSTGSVTQHHSVAGVGSSVQVSWGTMLEGQISLKGDPLTRCTVRRKGWLKRGHTHQGRIEG